MSQVDSSFFAVIEGLDGSGKTEVAYRLAQILRKTHPDKVKLTFEPHDPSCSGLFIRQVLMKRLQQVSERTLALAFAANRADHCDREISRYLGRGSHRIVVCDRYYLSSLVYQSGPSLSMAAIAELNSGVMRPDVTLFLDADDRVCYERMRRRPEDKELFEKNLKETRRKYETAIEYLRAQGERVVKVDANPSIDEVLKSVVAALSEYGPEWLVIQYPLSVEALPEVFSLNGTFDLKLDDLATEVVRLCSLVDTDGRAQFRHSIQSLQHVIEDRIWGISLNGLGSLFLDCLQRAGYRLHDRLPWTDLDAFELEYEMPLQTVQRGTALLLGEAQRYGLVTKKVLELDQLSDFMFILDPNPLHLINSHYERDIVNVSEDRGTLSPSTRVVTRIDVSRLVLARALDLYLDDANRTLGALGRRELFFETVRELGLDWQWHRVR